MRKWIVEEPGGERGEIYEIREVTDDEILEDRWNGGNLRWKRNMVKVRPRSHMKTAYRIG